MLARLQAASRPMAPAVIATVIEAELGASPEALFDRFDAAPSAAASIGQVHRAELDGRVWAVKVQYPSWRGWRRCSRRWTATPIRIPGTTASRAHFDFAHQLAAMRFLYKPALTAAPFRFTHEYVAEVHDRLAFKNANKLKLALPPDWLFVNRLQFGLFSVLAHLGATVRYDILFRDALG